MACAGAEPEEDSAGSAVSAAKGRLLGLGDSIAYGWEPDWSESQPNAPTNYANLKKVVLGKSYPEKVGARLDYTVANGSCPGEASASFLDKNGADNGCRDKRAAGLAMTERGTRSATTTGQLRTRRRVS